MELKNIAQSLLTFHKEMGKIYKTNDNPFFKSKYADLATILDAIKDPLEKAELVIMQFPTGNNGLRSILIDSKSGEFIEDTLIMTPAKNDPQGQGSAITYARRYALGSILQLNIDKDDDGNKASRSNTKPASASPAQLYQKAVKVISETTDKKILKGFRLSIPKRDDYDQKQKTMLIKLIDEKLAKN